MYCNLYKVRDLEFLAYLNDGEESELNPLWEAELVEENVDPSKHEDLQIIHIPETNRFKERTRDKVLEDAGIISFKDINCARFLVLTKELQKSKKIRDYVVEKYNEIIEFVKLEKSNE